MFSLKLCHTEDRSHGKYPVKKCDTSDDLSGEMLVPSWPNLVCFEKVIIVHMDFELETLLFLLLKIILFK